MSFQKYCDNIHLKDRHILAARPKVDGILHKVYDYFFGSDVTLDLDEKIGDVDGQFYYPRGCNFSYQSKDISVRVEGSKVILKASLYHGGDETFPVDELDLAPLIKFEDGKLQWV
ncbi:hypothetical protein FBU30_003367 [Linnemannia zychae]|nr:hypothetical protein FBU30_003367 [Linnemannia zychae]